MKTFELDYTCNRVSRRKPLTAKQTPQGTADGQLLKWNKNQIGPRELHEVGP